MNTNFTQRLFEYYPRKNYVYQGVSFNEIIVNKEAIANKDPQDLIMANMNFFNQMMLEGGFLPGEFSLDSLWSYYVDYYNEEVNNGGHAQDLFNSNGNPVTFSSCAIGLELFAKDFLDNYLEMQKNFNSPENQIDRRDRFAYTVGTIGLHMKKANDQFFAANKLTPLKQLNAGWLRKLPNVRAVESRTLRVEIEALYTLNPERTARLKRWKGE